MTPSKEFHGCCFICVLMTCNFPFAVRGGTLQTWNTDLLLVSGTSFLTNAPLCSTSPPFKIPMANKALHVPRAFVGHIAMNSAGTVSIVGGTSSPSLTGKPSVLSVFGPHMAFHGLDSFFGVPTYKKGYLDRAP